MTRWLWLSAGLSFLIGAGWLASRLDRNARERRSARFASRDKIDAGLLYEEKYRDRGVSRETVARVFALVGEEYEVDPETLRPDDSFDGTLVLSERDSITEDASVPLSDTVMEHARAVGVNPDLSKIHTLDDLVMLYAAIERAGRK